MNNNKKRATRMSLRKVILLVIPILYFNIIQVFAQGVEGISAYSIGGAIMQTNNLLNSGSQLNWSFTNKSNANVTLLSMQLIDGVTKAEGNLMSVNQIVEVGSTVSYTTTIGALGIHVPVTCRFRYNYGGREYSIDAVYTGSYGPDPISNCKLTIKATGNGIVTYNGTSIRNGNESFSIRFGGDVTINFTPDNGYRIKYVKVNNTDVTSKITNNQYKISLITDNKTVEVEFEATPTLSITSIGGGYVSYNYTIIRDKTSQFTVNEGVSATISFTPDKGYRIKSVKLNNLDVSSEVYNNQYTISSLGSSTSIVVEFELDPIKTYKLSITASGSGYVSYNSNKIRNQTSSFTVNENSSATISFVSDNGFRIKYVKANNADVTSNLKYNQYTINSISDNTSVEVEFEAIPPTTYTLTIKASGNGSVSYNGTSVRNNTQILTLNEGISAKVVFSPDDGYRIKSAKMNGREIGDLSTMSFTIDIMDEDVIIEVEFEAIPSSEPTQKSGECGENVYYSYDSSTHTLTIYGEGPMWNKDVGEVDNYPWWSLSDDIQHIVIELGVTSIGALAFCNCKGLTYITLPESLSYVDEHAFVGCENLAAVYISNLEEYLKIHFSNNNSNPLNIAHHLFLNGKEIIDLVIPDGIKYIEDYAFINGSSLKTVYIPNSVTFIGVDAFLGCSALTSVTIPSSVTSLGFGAFYGCSGLKAVISEIENPFTIDNNVFYGIPSDAQLIVPKGTKAKYQATAGWYQFTNIMEAGEEPDLPGQIHKDDIYFKVIGSGEVEVVSVEEGEKSVSIPSTISHNNTTYKVTSIAKEVFDNREYLAAVIWEPEAQFNATINNPNFLLYVKDEKYASHTVKNVVVNGVAERIELADAANGNDFYCPRAFTAKNISYSHNYQMETGLGESKGWETIVLPFDVQKYTHATKGELETFTTWSKSSNKKPFWLFELTADGYKDVAGIKANTPYIISMPNNKQYEQQYQIPGVVTFSATNVEVKKSDDMKSVSYQGRIFVPNYTNQDNLDYLLLNVNGNYVTYLGADAGSKFIGGLRSVHPFEAYMTTTDGTRSIDVLDGMTTAIKDIYMIPDDTEIIKVYDTKGVLVKTVKTNDGLRSGLAAGIYIVNGKKMIIK